MLPRSLACVGAFFAASVLFTSLAPHVWAANAASAAGNPTRLPPFAMGENQVPVELPPFVITETKIKKPWRYAASEGFEIIAQCDDSETQQVFAALWRGPRLTLPPELWPKHALPTAVVLFDQSPDEAGAKQAVGFVAGHYTNVIKRTLHDREVFGLNLHGRNFTYASTFRYDLRSLFALRTPTPPSWLQEALHGAFANYERVFCPEGSRTVELNPMLWAPTGEFQAAKDLVMVARKRLNIPPEKRAPAPAAASPLTPYILPLERLWTTDPMADRAPRADVTRWSATAALFVRWGLAADNGRHYDAFWRFAIAASAQPVTEAFFRECFGLGYEEARAELAWYLPIAISEPARRKIAPLEPPKLAFRPATPAEVARLRGEFEYGEALILSARYPDLAAQYREQAGRTLGRRSETAPEDPSLAATLALLEFDAGNADRARTLLESASAGPLRPRAWFTLAQLRFNAASASPATPPGQFDAAQAAGVHQALQGAFAQTPAMASSYELLAELWRHSPDLPTAEIVARLIEGQRMFPRDARLALVSAKACFERGERTESLAFLDRALAFATETAARTRLEKAREALAGWMQAKGVPSP